MTQVRRCGKCCIPGKPGRKKSVRGKPRGTFTGQKFFRGNGRFARKRGEGVDLGERLVVAAARCDFGHFDLRVSGSGFGLAGFVGVGWLGWVGFMVHWAE